MRKKQYIILGIFMLLFFGFLHKTTIAEEYQLLESMPGVGEAGESGVTISNYSAGIYNFIIAFIVVGALLMITIGGFAYVTSAGNQAQAGTAKGIITDAVLGLVVVLTIFLILNTINSDLLNVDLNFGPIMPTGNTTNMTRVSSASTISCGSVGGAQNCYASQSACASAGARGCSSGGGAINKNSYYRQANGVVTEISKEEFNNCTNGGGNCMTGEQAKKKIKYTTLTEEENKKDLNDAGVTVAPNVSVEGLPEITKQAVIDVGGERCANGGCEKQIIHTEGNGTNIADLADNSGIFFDSELVNSIQDEAVEMKSIVEDLPGGTHLKKRIRKIKTYVYPKGHPLEGNTVQVIQEGLQLKKVGWVPFTFKPTSSKVRVLGEKYASPPSSLK